MRPWSALCYEGNAEHRADGRRRDDDGVTLRRVRDKLDRLRAFELPSGSGRNPTALGR
jgi:hypothetical protein